MSSNNPFQPPESELADPRARGSLERAARGEFELSIGAVLNDAWEALPGRKGKIWVAAILGFLPPTLLALGLQMAGLDATPYLLEGDINRAMLIQLAQALIMMPVQVPLMAGLYMFVLKLLVRKDPGYGEVFAYFGQTWPLVGTSLLTLIATYLGLALLILPGLFISIALFFTIPLVAAYDLGPVEAIVLSFKSVSRRWFTVFGVLIMLSLILVAGAFLFLVGLIWALPMFFLGTGIVFLCIFGRDWVQELDPAAGQA